jgi:hypothetical protein
MENLKHLYQSVVYIIHQHYAEGLGSVISSGYYLTSLAKSTTEQSIAMGVLMAAIFALIGGIFGGIGKWIIDEIREYRNKLRKKK